MDILFYPINFFFGGNQGFACVCWTIFSPPLRFRSIAKSYFRRADGVLLLYDITCEKSFLNVREWVDMIEVMHHSPLSETLWNTTVLFIHLSRHIFCYIKTQYVKVLSHVLLSVKLNGLACFSLFTCSRHVSVGCKACADCVLLFYCEHVQISACSTVCGLWQSIMCLI